MQLVRGMRCDFVSSRREFHCTTSRNAMYWRSWYYWIAIALVKTCCILASLKLCNKCSLAMKCILLIYSINLATDRILLKMRSAGVSGGILRPLFDRKVSSDSYRVYFFRHTMPFCRYCGDLVLKDRCRKCGSVPVGT